MKLEKKYFENNNNVDKLVEMLRVNHMLRVFKILYKIF